MNTETSNAPLSHLFPTQIPILKWGWVRLV